MIQKAMDFAIEAHEGQVDKQGRAYHLHVRKVAAGVLEYDTNTIVAAILHDVVEDTEHSIFEIEDFFGSDVADMVEALTRDKSETYGAYMLRILKHGNFSTLLIKRSDLRTNLSDLPQHMHSLRERYATFLELIEAELTRR